VALHVIISPTSLNHSNLHFLSFLMNQPYIIIVVTSPLYTNYIM
jgi:hypothetical protein